MKNKPLNDYEVKLSIVTTLYKSSEFLHDFHIRVKDIGRNFANNSYEIIYVNNDCPDGSFEIVNEIMSNDNNTCLIDLSRNFGHHNAIMSGLNCARGELIYLIDSDLEEQPEDFYTFHDVMKSQKCDVVYGVQKYRRGGIIEKFTGLIFYKLFNYLTKLSIPENLTTSRLMSKRYVKALLLYEEREVTLAGLWQIVGFEQRPVFVNKSRNRKSTYSIIAKVSLFINAITSFSNIPLIIIFYFGILTSSIAIVFNIILFIQWLFLNKPLVGWTSIMGSIWLVGGLLFSFIGIVGIYLAKIYTETKMRPRVIIREVIKKC